MELYTFHPVANGLSTDHPIPDLPFVDDRYLPLDDPVALEAIGRKHGTDTWGRQDKARRGGQGWLAFTTEPQHRTLAWCVRWHPEHGRSVVVYRDAEAAEVHMAWWNPTLLWRAGGYWWDGTQWYRPAQIWDPASEEYVRRRVPAARTVSAADLLEGMGDLDASRARLLTIEEVDPDAPPVEHWRDHLALWAEQREQRDLAACVVNLTAPELSADQMVGAAEVARIAEVAPSTLRSYIARGQADVPQPQATINGHPVWARPVAEDWAEQRRRSAEGVTAALSTQRFGASVPQGVAQLWEQFTNTFASILWQNPLRKRWALRWRTQQAVQEVADALGWHAATSLNTVIPVADLAITVRYAILDEFATGQASHGDTEFESWEFFGLLPQVARMYDWLIRHDPATARVMTGDLVGEAERRWNIPRAVSYNSLITALTLDGKLDHDAASDFLDRVLTNDQPEPAE